MPLPLRHPGALVAILLVLPELAAAAERCAVPAGHIAAVEDLVEVAAGADWTRLALGEPLCVGDTLRAGENGRSAVILASGAVLRLAPGTTLRIEQAQPGERTLLQLITGIASFFSRRPHALEIDTPFADAAVEGTEFTLEVEPDRSRLTVLEGRVRFANPLGTVRVAPGEAAVALAGRAPELELRIRPRDAVQWALYYPPLPETRLPAAAPAPLREAARLAAQGRRTEALARLDQLPPFARDATGLTLRAELLLAQGRPAEAETALAEALIRDPHNTDALALRAVIAVARNLKDQALADAGEAVTLDSTNPRARLALSYAAQAAFDIPQARESLEAAATSTPDDALIQARLAEVLLMQGDTRAAHRSATRALELDPTNPRAQTVAGFVALARIDTHTAHATFTRTIELDPFNPLAHLGQGLATIRDGGLEAGRASIELAVALDPDNALLRSYLGKAYLEERRGGIAADELATAKALDPNDPTPWYYGALAKQLDNRPIEALQELERSIALNQGRALYRSRMLLDEDAAGRSVSAGRIYNDLGFRQLGINEAVRSLALDPANAASHRFLANLYRGEPRLETVRLSEQLQARLLQPVGRNPVQPSLSFADLGSLQQGGPARASFNEFTSLFERDGLQGDATLLAGSDYTRADEAALTGLFGRTAFSVGQLYFDTEGTRPNDELTHEIYTAFAQVALTDALDVQIGFRSRDSDKGDRARQVPDEFDENLTAERDDKVLNLGAKLRVAPTHTFLVSATFADRDASDISDSGSGPSEERVEIRERQQGVQAELQYIQDLDRSALVAGAGAYNTPQGEDNSILLTDVFGPEPNEYTVDLDQHGAFAYTYFTSTPLHNLTLTTGIALDTYDQPSRSDTRLEPKFGLTYSPTSWLLLRGAAFDLLKRGQAIDETLEPLQLAGFNQVTDEYGGSRIRGVGVGADLRPTAHLAFGVEASRRQVSPPFIGYDTVSGDRAVILRDHEDRLIRAYAYLTPTPRLALSLAVERAEFRQDVQTAQGEPTGIDEYRVPLSARLFLPGGIFSEAAITWITQSVTATTGERSDSPHRKSDDAILSLDATVGYRLLQGRVVAAIEAYNILDQTLTYQDSSFRTPTSASLDEQPDPTFFNERTLLMRLALRF